MTGLMSTSASPPEAEKTIVPITRPTYTVFGNTNGQQRSQLDHEGNIEFVREKGKDQINDQLCEKIDENQKSQKRIGNAVHRPKGEEEQGREIADNGHGDVGGIARQLDAFDGRLHNRILFLEVDTGIITHKPQTVNAFCKKALKLRKMRNLSFLCVNN